MPELVPAYAIIAGAGSAGLTWAPVARELGAVVMPMPDAGDVRQMAAALQARVAALPEARVLVGSSAGGMVALEVETPLTERYRSGSEYERLVADIPLGRWGNLDEVARVVRFVAGDAASYVTGAVIPVDGGWST